MKKSLFIALIISFFCFSPAFGQRNKTDEKLSRAQTEKLADFSLQEGKFEKALLLYRRMLNSNKQNPKLNFLLGYCYLNTEFGHEKAILYLKNSIEYKPANPLEEVPLEAYYYLATAYHQDNKYDLAIEILEKLFTKIPNRNQLFKFKANQLKEYCENAAMLTQTSVEIKVENLFELNSKYSDKNPLIINGGREMIFTSRRENPLLRKKGIGKQYDDNIYYCRKEDGNWTIPYVLGNSVNTINHESACWVSKDGNYLIIQRDQKKKSNILFSQRKTGGDWSVPENFPSPINTRNNETFGSLSPDEKYLFFTSDRKGGFGGSDIYMSKNLGNNTWGEAINLGPKINTSMNEESPFMHENGVLFFCSEGHVSMGGFDIFTSFRDEQGKWHAPANIGTPINSIEDEFFYQPLPNGQFAYASSERKGSKGKSDIFKLQLNDSNGTGYALITGKIDCSKNAELNKNIEIQVTSISDKDTINILKPNNKGNFTLSLPANKDYYITYYFNQIPFYAAILKFPRSYSYMTMDQSVRLKNVKLSLDDNLQLISNTVQNSKREVYYSEEKLTEAIKSERVIASEELTLSDSTILSDLGLADEVILSGSNVSDRIYSIKIASSKLRMSLSAYTGVEDVKEYRESNGNYIYYFGEYNYEWEAEIKLRLIRENYPKASIFINHFMQKVPN